MLSDSVNMLSDRKSKIFYRFLAYAGLAGIIVSLSTGNIAGMILVLAIPFSLLLITEILEKPSLLLYIIFTVNYFLLAVLRYAPNLVGIGVVMDVLLVSELLVLIINGVIRGSYSWRDTINSLTIGAFVWMLYCVLEIVNPTAMIQTWFLSRSLVFNGLIIAVIVTLVISRFKQVQIIMNLYAVFTLLAVAKAFMQKFIGFDASEQRWLDDGGAVTHIISSGIRYFSFFSDAGNFGSNMGCAAIVFFLSISFVKEKGKKIIYLILGSLALYAMFMSGTRGAIIVPLAGMVIYLIASKNVKAIVTGSIFLLAVYSFFAFTYIGDGNMMIRRMRTAFHPNKDASYLVRKQNQEILKGYLKNKPFGEGLGLSGGDNKKLTYRLTTSIPNDSWYVKIWVETGVVGLLLYIVIFVVVIGNCLYVLITKIKNREVKGILTAMLCGVFGLLASAYGNPFFGQFPTMIIAFTFLAINLNGEKIDKQYTETHPENQLKT